MFSYLPAYPQYYLSYDYVIDLAFEAIKNNDLDNALYYFRIAQILKPYAEEPIFYINLIKRIKEGRVKEVVSREIPSLPVLPKKVYKKEPDEKAKPKKIEKEEVLELSKEVKREKGKKELTRKRKKSIEKALSLWEKITKKKPLKAPKPSSKIISKKQREEIPPEKKEAVAYKKEIKEAKLVSPGKYIPSKKIAKITKKRTLYLTDELFSAQPNTTIQIAINEALIIEGESIKRYLVVDKRVINVERIDDKRIKVVAKNIGITFLHIWEQDRRWTFNVKVTPPIFVSPKEERKLVYYSEPFKFLYNAEWRSYYKGRRLGTMDRKTLSFDQWLGFYGETPYGVFDGSLRLAKYGNKIELTNYTLGLTDGNIFGFKDFNVRIFDIYKGFSQLSYPGELVKGILWESYAFNKKVSYSVIWGKEREAAYGYITPGVLAKRESYIEGVRLMFFPLENTRYSFNYARGYGSGRETYLKDSVYSFEFAHSRNGKHITSEIAYNEDSIAATVNSSFNIGKARFGVNFRDIEKNFTTITGRPADQGEIGALLSMSMDFSNNTHLSTSLDIYRDRYMFNPSKKRKPNFDWQFNINKMFSDNSSLSANIYYTNDPGLSFPRRYLSIRTNYSKSIKLFNGKRLSFFIGPSYQRSRNPLSKSSDYDIYNIFSGLRYYLTSNLSYYINYTYGWLTERIDGSKSSPFVWETGIDYYKKFNPRWRGDFRFYYRDEEDTTSTHSFLAGEDSIEGSLRLTYSPVPDVEFFIDGRVRNVWAEEASTQKYIEGEIRLGLKSTFDLPFSFSPKGKISGFVFKDLNGDGKKDKDDSFISGVKIKIGKKEVVTDRTGHFSMQIRAKKVVVSVDPQSLPSGYVFTTPSNLEVEIENGVEKTLEFGVTTNSGIYGVVFYDANGNNKFDDADVPIRGVSVSIGKKAVVTDSEGRYFFRGLRKGEYSLFFDINTVPLKYIPSVPIKKAIELSEGVNYLYNIPFTLKK